MKKYILQKQNIIHNIEITLQTQQTRRSTHSLVESIFVDETLSFDHVPIQVGGYLKAEEPLYK